MTFHHLEVFAAVCQEKTMHAAAQKLNISQPAISKSIADLEKYYGIKLFERINHRLYLTPIGEIMRGYALQILGMFQDMEDEINIQGKHDHIRIGASVSVGTRLLPPFMKKLTERLDRMTYEVVVSNTSEIEQLVNDYALDVAIVEGYVDNPDLVVRHLFEDELVMVVRAGHPLCGKEEVSDAELQQYPFITREDGSRKRNQLEQYLQQQGLVLTMNYSCTSIEAIKQALLYTDSISVLSKMMVAEEVKKGVLTVLPRNRMHLKRSIRLIYHKNKYISPAIKAFFALLDEEVAQREGKTMI